MAGSRLVELLGSEHPSRQEIAALLDGLDRQRRMEEVTALAGPGLQGRLYAAAGDAPRVGLDDLVPPDYQPLREVIFHGKNSLPAFTLFQKRFCRPPAARTAELWGYNHQALAWLTGPGYFVVHDEPANGAAIDYREVPPQGCPNSPPVRPNDRGFSRFVYKDMVDYLRRVSTHVMIGRATRHGKPLDNSFVLCRE